MRLTAVVLLLFGIWTANDNFYQQGLVAIAEKEQSISLPVLMYHSVVKKVAKQGEYIITVDQLKKDILYLKSQGYETVSIAQLIAYVEEDAPLPEKPVLLTFDDGFYNNYCYVYPVLKETNSKAVISVVGSFVEAASPDQENAGWSYLTSKEIGELATSGLVEIENHSYDFHHLKGRNGCLPKKGEPENTYKAIFRNDTLENQKIITESGAPLPLCYTYTFGAYNKETEQMLKEMGFLCTLGCQEGINQITHQDNSLYLLKRYNRASGKSSAAFLKPILQKAEKAGGKA